MNAWYLSEKDLRMELWLWRAYMRCGSDIFCPTIFSDDLEWRLTLTDGVYVKEPADRSNKDLKQKKLGEHEYGGNLGEIAEVYTHGFYLEDIFIGLWDRITNKWYEDVETFAPIIQDMKNHWTEYVSPAKDNQDYHKMWEDLRLLLHDQIARNYETILRCNQVLDAIEDDWDQMRKDEWKEKSTAKRVIEASQQMLDLLARVERNEINISELKRIRLDLLEDY
jgi:hypothetical protein